MRISNRLFPYPVLNNELAISDYSESASFEIKFDDSEEMLVDGDLRLNNIYISSTDEYLNSLARGNRVKGLLIIECPNSIFREKYNITFEPQDIKIPISCFSGEVQISAFIYATEDIDNFVSPNFSSEYKDYHFKVEKYCILAADDTLHVDVDNQPDTDNKNTSIFTIVCDKQSTNDIMRCQSNNHTGKIDIIMPKRYYEDYMVIKSSPSLLNASFAIIAIPVLTERIMDIQNQIKEEGSDYTMDEICSEHRWFRAVIKAFERVKNRPLTIEYLKSEIHPMELAQIILNSSTCNGIENLSNLLIGKKLNDEELYDD
ncbi:hypothetical protein IJI86_00950 [Candidatus Saccharibacteria bacterium]|nr:hypothetical protein [Candidatus Saccharibacteria bacterium]